ncbi:stalk domain-containing protein [Desulfosporosinus metallidurans]|uniref:Copper amine oxidase-like N-terminal domain-containing protein n=1 Tax=Desulfosporosinus metallidurans TaxID=1888891 RepID=A0A1Q8QWN7_9FIRM|nr:stalk domain-containing protein [Desulfosporosinus metallidurans]OLN31726.1 hypothetical protein DSOL_2414 [Desulfosporosinus metallidurans]
MRIYSKVVSILLIFALFIVGFPAFPTNADEELKEYSLKLIGTSISDENVSVFQANGRMMMSIKDVAKITRCELNSQGDVFTLKHAKGLRTIKLDVGKQTLTENGEEYKIYIVRHDNTILVPVYSILTYLGAYCSTDSANASLIVCMPLQTFWEAYAFTSEQKMNVTNYSDTTKNIRVVCDLIVDFLATSSGQSMGSIIIDGVDESSAVYAALEADINKYQSVKSATQARAKKFNDVTRTLSTLEKTQNAGFDLLFLLDDANRKQAYDAIYSFSRRSDQLQSYKNFQDTIKNRDSFKNAYKGVGYSIDASLLLVDTFTAVYDRMQIDSTAKDAFSNTFSADTLEVAGNPALNGNYLSAARSTSKTLSSSTNTVTGTFFEKATDLAADKSIEFGLKNVVVAFGASPGTPLLLSVEIGGIVDNLLAYSPVGKYTPFSMIPASEADLMAILSSGYYEQARLVMAGLAKKAESEKLHNAETMKLLYDSYMLLLRFSLIHYESLIKYAEYQNIDSAVKANQEQRAEAIAKTIDELNHCNPAPIPNLSDLNSQCVTFDESLKQLLMNITVINDGKWKNAYINYIQNTLAKNGTGYFQDAWMGYKLIFIDDDEIPELVAIGNCEAQGNLICVYHNGVINSTQLSRNSFTYIKKGNLLCNAAGNMGDYYHKVFTIKDGVLSQIAAGFWGYTSANVPVDETGNPIYKYKWENKTVTEKQYYQLLNSIYDTTKAIDGNKYLDNSSVEKIVNIIKDY